MTGSIVNKDRGVESNLNDPEGRSRMPGVNKARDYVGLMVNALPLIGAVGTVFVWIFCSVYVGNVELTSSKPFRSILVQVFNEKGNESEFHSPRFQLMPGDYLFLVSLDGQPPTKCSAIVRLHEKVLVPMGEQNQATIAPAANTVDESLTERPKKRWWQFWRR